MNSGQNHAAAHAWWGNLQKYQVLQLVLILTEKLLVSHCSQERKTDLRMWKAVEMFNFISPLSLAQRVQPQSLSQRGEFFCWPVFPCFHFLCSCHVQPIPYHLCFSTHCSQQGFGVNFPHQDRSGTALLKRM